jgi:hypothetical protein
MNRHEEDKENKICMPKMRWQCRFSMPIDGDLAIKSDDTSPL